MPIDLLPHQPIDRQMKLMNVALSIADPKAIFETLKNYFFAEHLLRSATLQAMFTTTETATRMALISKNIRSCQQICSTQP